MTFQLFTESASANARTVIRELPWDASESDVETAIAGMVGREINKHNGIQVQRTGSCHKGHIWSITDTNSFQHGYLPKLQISTSSQGALVEMTNDQEIHRLNLRPIPGGMTMSAHRSPQVQLRVASSLAMMSSGGGNNDAAGFTFFDVHMPVIQSLTPTQGTIGTRLTIQLASTFTSSLSNRTTSVILGPHALCEITSIVGSSIECVVSVTSSTSSSPPGPVPLRVLVDPHGYSNAKIFTFVTVLQAVTPSTGSRLGGMRMATPLRRMSGPVLSVKEGDHIVCSSTTNQRLSPTASHRLSHTATQARARTALDVNSLEKGIPRFRSPEDIH